MSRQLFCSALGVFILSTGLRGESITVTTVTDELDASADPALGTGTSLREALAWGTPPLMIDFAPSLNSKTFTGGNFQTGAVATIDASALPGGITLFSREFRVLPAGDVTFKNCRFAGRYDTSVRPIVNEGALTLEDCVVRDYKFTIRSGAKNGLVVNVGIMTMNRCTLRDNKSQQTKCVSGGLGGAVYNRGMLEMNDCHLHRNYAGHSGAGVWSGAGGEAIIRRCTFTENFSEILGGAVSNLGWNIFQSGSISLHHCTFVDNFRGAIVLLNSGCVESCTVINNRGFGVFAHGGSPTGVAAVTISNSIVAGNDPDLRVLGRDAEFHAPRPSLLGAPAGEVLIGPVAPLLGDPKLVGPAYFGSYAPIYLPGPESPAREAGEITEPDIDQSGTVRPAGTVDLGSVEADPSKFERKGFAQWVFQFLPPDVDRSFLGNADHDRSLNGTEFAIGSDPFRADGTNSPHPFLRRLADGRIEITFGCNPDALSEIEWRLHRTTGPAPATLVYRLHGPTAKSETADGVDAVKSDDLVTVSDTTSPQPNTIYTPEVIHHPVP